MAVERVTAGEVGLDQPKGDWPLISTRASTRGTRAVPTARPDAGLCGGAQLSAGQVCPETAATEWGRAARVWDG
jgi:hypothetical protein